MLHQTGFDPKPILDVFSLTPSCSPTMKANIAPMLEQRFAALIPIELVEKDVRYAIAMTSPQSAHAPVLSAVRESYQNAIDEGYGADNITGIVQRFVHPAPEKVHA
jgi:3-hydroxyisobutyrate dehydrogenase